MTDAVGVWSADRCVGRMKGTSIIVAVAMSAMGAESVLSIVLSINLLCMAASKV